MQGTIFGDYRSEAPGFYDEIFDHDRPRGTCSTLIDFLDGLPNGELQSRQRAAEQAMMRMGITFTVYGERSGTERIIPFDLIPRVIDAAEWERLDLGLRQRTEALNCFLQDVYGAQRILEDGVLPRDLILGNPAYRSACVGLHPPRGVWNNVSGTDLIRDRDGTTYVLEDNMRVPSGVSYVLENRALMKRSFPRLFEQLDIMPVDDYPRRLLEMLTQLAGDGVADPQVVVLTPGIYNSAYFEHAYLAREMGVELVEGRDLVVVDGLVCMRTTTGLQRVDVIYRRLDDDFLDPDVFRSDSTLGVPGLMAVYRAGRVAIANAPGTGIADDKAVYAYTPDIIRYYLDQDPIIPIVPTWICRDPKQLEHVLAHLPELVVKATDGAGGYGMLVGPQSSDEQIAAFTDKLRADPAGYIAQPTLCLSRVPTIIDGERLEGRHVDLRPYILHGSDIYVQPGGLTRVALRKGSLVVNSSQGGGSKDTWVLAGRAG
ncbi:MAG: circularly permuted type 2 ATP-grasp protein [Planctomycetota bacterium]